jgi:tRNA-uridine 2-sulfurtransferase
VRVLAAMSGGVDSAVAAARAVDVGHDVTGVHLALAAKPVAFREGARGCCTLEDARDARRAADVLGIPFYVWDLAERFREDVIDDFVAEYAAGRTPNPCLRCNEKIKFSAVLDRATALGFDTVVTGHYAQVSDGAAGRELHRAVDPAKDQSYVLGVLTREQLARAWFPLGDTPKPQVREEAARRDLLVADKPDSHDICFVADGDTAGFLRDRLGSRPGDIVDADGAVLGSHDGAYAFTIGQRRGLDLGVPAADGRPRYVLDISPVSNTVTVGPAEALEVSELLGSRPTWLVDVPAGELAAWLEASDLTVQVRAHAEPVACTAELVTAGVADLADGAPAHETAPTLRLRLAEPVRGVAPGQGLVLYASTRVIGAATAA